VSIRTDHNGDGAVDSTDDALDLLSPTPINGEHEGARTEVDISAGFDVSGSNWRFVLPDVPGVEFWTSAEGGTRLTPDAHDNLIDVSLSSGSYNQTLWCSFDETEIPDNVQIDPSAAIIAQIASPTGEKAVAQREAEAVAQPGTINLWMGDTRDSKQGLNPFYKANAGKKCDWFGVVGCGAFGPGGTKPLSLPAIPDDQQIPGLPDCGGPDGRLRYDQAAGAARDALKAAKALKTQLIEDKTCTKVNISIQLTTTYLKVLRSTPEGQMVLHELNPYLMMGN